MKVSKFMSALALFGILAFSSCSSESLNEDENINLEMTVPDTKPIEEEVLNLINNYRQEQGLNSLYYNGTVKAVAFTHTDYMIEENDVSHHNFYVRKQNLQVSENAQVVSENVAFGYTSAESLVNAWINSPSHKQNLEGDYTHFDISAEQNQEGDWFYTNIFIKK